MFVYSVRSNTDCKCGCNLAWSLSYGVILYMFTKDCNWFGISFNTAWDNSAGESSRYLLLILYNI